MNKAFDTFSWVNEPDHSTPLSAENLNKVNNALDTIDDRVVTFDSTLQPKTDNSLSTSTKTVTGAINELDTELNALGLSVVSGAINITYEED